MASWSVEAVHNWLADQLQLSNLLTQMQVQVDDVSPHTVISLTQTLTPCLLVQGLNGRGLAALTDAALQEAGVKSKLLRRQLLNRRDEALLGEDDGHVDASEELVRHAQPRSSCWVCLTFLQ